MCEGCVCKGHTVFEGHTVCVCVFVCEGCVCVTGRVCVVCKGRM